MLDDENDESKILAYKLAWLDIKNLRFTLYDLPDVEWPLNRQLKATCSYGHKAPVEACTCGIRSYSNSKLVQGLWSSATSPEFPLVVATVQVYGTTFFDQDGGSFRSEFAYIWGLVKPKWTTDILWSAFWNTLHEKYGGSSDDIEIWMTRLRLAHHRNFAEARKAAQEAWVNRCAVLKKEGKDIYA